jgi:hypothetical protein
MNKGYAFGFILVILVLVLGFYVAYTGFMSTRETLQANSTPPLAAEEGQVTRIPTLSLATAVPVSATVPLTLLGVTPTLADVPEVTSLPESTSPPVSAAPEATQTQGATTLPTATSTSAELSATPTALTQPPTPIPVPAYQFRVAGPASPDPDYANCCYIYGTVRDATGNGLEGIRVQASNEWTPPVYATSKGGPDLGKYDIPVNTEIKDWYITLVDQSGNQMSSEVRIRFDPESANGYRLDWTSTY